LDYRDRVGRDGETIKETRGVQTSKRRGKERGKTLYCSNSQCIVGQPYIHAFLLPAVLKYIMGMKGKGMIIEKEGSHQLRGRRCETRRDETGVDTKGVSIEYRSAT
jgi:hypothetical protein